MITKLEKGQTVSLDGTMNPMLVSFCLNRKEFPEGVYFDFDLSAFLCGANGKVTCDEDFMFYCHLKRKDNAVYLFGDDIPGYNFVPDEWEKMIVNLENIPRHIQEIVITLTLYEAESRRQNFGQVAGFRLMVSALKSKWEADAENALQFDISEDFTDETALILCKLARGDDGWRLHMLAEGSRDDLASLCRRYGVKVDD